MATLQEELGFALATPNRFQRLIKKAGSSSPGAWILSKTLEPVDKLILRVTKARLTAAGVLAAAPVITLTTTGARTGKVRSSLVLGIPLEGTLAIIGTNYGQGTTPGWVYNLEANPSGVVTYRTVTARVIARAANATEFEEVFRRSIAVYPGYPEYRKRAAHRQIRVFILDTAQ